MATECTSCHVAETTATEYNSASTGLHARAGTITLENHTSADASVGDNTDSNLCTHCHGLPSAHFTGLDTQALDALAAADFVSTFDGTGGHITPGSGCAVTCHSDTQGGAPQWTRLWSDTIDNGEPAVCANCHGTFAQGWTAGAV